MDYGYLLTLGCIILSTKLFGLLFQRIHLPQVVGALSAGLLLGPAVLGAVTQGIFGEQICLQPSDFLNSMAELGVIVIMFSAGMNTSINDLKNSGLPGFVVALSGVLLPLAMGAGLLIAFEPGSTMVQALFIGAILTATSVSITVETLKELGKLSTRSGNTILAAALIDDVLGLICLAVVTGMAGERVSMALIAARIGGFFVFVAVMSFLYGRFMRWSVARSKGDDLSVYPVIGFSMCLFMAWTADTVFGMADIVGAFCAGAIIAVSPKGSYIESKFGSISDLLLTPIFFANIGLKVVLPHLSAHFMLFTAAITAVAVLSKLIGCGFGARICGFTNSESLRVGLGMVCRGEVALIVANKGMAMNMINADYVGPIIILIIVCTILTPIFLKYAYGGDEHQKVAGGVSEHFSRLDAADRALDRTLGQ